MPTRLLTSRTQTGISVRLGIGLEPNRPPRSSTPTGRITERGSGFGAASPCLVPRLPLISPRRVPPPRDVGADAHAYTENTASTSELGECRRGPRAARASTRMNRTMRSFRRFTRPLSLTGYQQEDS
ncbi:hypothetical protein K523DRAFT_358740 [Schizophyllum commune Tattone D]|nr:hypothetical protein K523DRAFT_358740 [Schizophyllum commune Tattone D]